MAAASGCSSSGDDGNGADEARGSELTTHDNTATSSDEGGCRDEQSNRAAPPDHVDPGTEMSYAGVPPVSGVHWAKWPDITKILYGADERPELGQLVHSEEHGWVLAWYDDSIADGESAMSELSDAADQVDDTDPTKIVFVPWTASDGAAFPGGAHVALTAWSGEDDGTEWRQFCRSPDAAAVLAFSERHPYTAAREPNGP